MRTQSKYTEGIGERIRWVRNQSNLTQEEFSSQLNISRQMISGYESERMPPSRGVIEAISDRYAVNPWWVEYGIGDPSPDETDSRFAGKVPHSSARDPLSVEQRALIDYIRSDSDVALQLARKLWNNALQVRKDH